LDRNGISTSGCGASRRGENGSGEECSAVHRNMRPRVS
jgi:hypothetical protein